MFTVFNFSFISCNLQVGADIEILNSLLFAGNRYLCISNLKPPVPPPPIRALPGQTRDFHWKFTLFKCPGRREMHFFSQLCLARRPGMERSIIGAFTTQALLGASGYIFVPLSRRSPVAKTFPKRVYIVQVFEENPNKCFVNKFTSQIIPAV